MNNEDSELDYNPIKPKASYTLTAMRPEALEKMLEDARLEEREQLKQKISDLETEIEVGDNINNNLMKVMEAIPGCRLHGNSCVSHAVEWVEKMKTGNEGGESNLQYLRQNIRLWGVKNGLATLKECARVVEPAWLGQEMFRVIVSLEEGLDDLPTLASLRRIADKEPGA